MCGIAGLISLEQRTLGDLPRRLDIMSELLANRGPDGAGKLVGHHYLFLALNDLKGLRQVRRTRHSGQVALRLGIQRLPVLVILGFLCGRLRNDN